MDADANREKSTTFRWINVARYAVASVVTVLIATVIVIAIKTVMRPDSLKVEVLDGTISVKNPPGSPPDQLQLVFTVDAVNPSGRAAMYFYNITCYLFDKNISASTPDPVAGSFVWFNIEDQAVPQQQEVDSHHQTVLGPDVMTLSYFQMLYNNRSTIMDDVTMRMEGYVVTEPISGHNTTARWTTYYCSPLVVGWAPATTGGGQNDKEASKNKQGGGFCAEVVKSTVSSAR